MKAALYYRVSTPGQATEDKYSLRSQKEELTKYAASQGWIVVGEFQDVGSGGKLEKKGLNQLLDFVEEGNCEVVLCIDQDRLSRLDSLGWEFLKSTLRENRVKIAEPGFITDLDNEDDEFISDLKNLIARREKKKIVLKMMRGKRQRTREGKGWGKTFWEYNYDKATGTYTTNEDWAWVIPFIDKLYIDKNYSYKAIAKELNKISLTPTGKAWNSELVGIRLKSKAFHGVLEKNFKNEGAISADVPVYPPLRTLETYERICKLRKEKFKRKKIKYPHFLRKVHFKCAECQRKLSIAHSKNTYETEGYFYLAHGRHIDCKVSINSIRFDKNISKAIKEILKSESMAKKYVKIDHTQKDLEDMEKQVKAERKNLTKVSEKKDLLLPLYLEGKFPKEQLDKQYSMLEAQEEHHKKQVRSLEEKLHLIKSKMFNYNLITSYLSVAERFENLLTVEEQTEMISTLFPKGVVYDNEILLEGYLSENVPIEIAIPIDPDPFNVKNKWDRDPLGRYNKIQDYMNKHPNLTQKQIAEALDMAPSTIVRLRDKFGEYKNYTKVINHDPKGKAEILKEYYLKNPEASLRKTARDTGISTTTIRRIKKDYGI
ncbi:recombinase family protein [Bacillus altitudinis]|uniref:recombinase family protein n=1 Tax=Bacillus altitudinis TaxID=293387 RepID=UPI002D78C03C|nr:recombinase family protein [Bacillus altitudinis]WRO24402.1 recombinase family protein [Bacillus altitudinis]